MTLLQSSEINYQSLDSLQSVSLCDAFLVCFYSHCDPTLKAINIAMPITHPAIVFVFLAMLQGVHTLASLSPCSPVPRPPTRTTMGVPRSQGTGIGCGSGHRWLLVWMTVLLLVVPPHLVDGRYLPTRSHGDDLDKLRELMLQVSKSTLGESFGASVNSYARNLRSFETHYN